MSDETPWIETEILIAVMNENYARAREMIRMLGHGELKLFRRQLLQAIVLVDHIRESRDRQ